MPTKPARSESTRSGPKRSRDPNFVAPSERRLVVFREGIRSGTEWESVTESLLRSSEDWIVSHSRTIQRPALLLELGFRQDSNLLSVHNLQLYAKALADRIKTVSGVQFSSVRLSKRHSDSTSVAVVQALQWERPAGSTEVTITTRRSYATPAFGQEVEEATRSFRNIIAPNAPLGLHVSYKTGLPRTWSRLWGPTVSGVCARASQKEKVDSAQIVKLGFDHLSVGEQLGHRVQLTISASRMRSEG